MRRLGFFLRVAYMRLQCCYRGSWPWAAGNQRLPLILSLCRGVMATFHSTEFSMESVIRGHHTYITYGVALLVRNLSAGLQTGNVCHFITKIMKIYFRKWSKIFEIFINKGIRKITIIR